MAKKEGFEQNRKVSGLSRFARDLISGWRRLELPREFPALIVGVSGGADSVALALALNELIQARLLSGKAVVAHLDHGLREESATEAKWVGQLAAKLGFEYVSDRLGTAAVTELRQGNLEQAARLARYSFFRRTAIDRGAGLVLTGHTLDDQAETVLMSLIRGSGLTGLGGMKGTRRLDPESGILLARPMLDWARRADTESYCQENGVEPRFDQMNEDESFARVRVRKRLIPVIETLNPKAVQAISRTARMLREDSSFIKDAARELLNAASAQDDLASILDNGGTREGQSILPPLRVDMLNVAPPSLRRKALRLWLEQGRGTLRRLELAHIIGVERLLSGQQGGRVAELPGELWVERRKGFLLLKDRKR